MFGEMWILQYDFADCLANTRCFTEVDKYLLWRWRYDIPCHVTASAVDVMCLPTSRRALILVIAVHRSVHPFLWLHLLAVTDKAGDRRAGYTRVRWVFYRQTVVILVCCCLWAENASSEGTPTVIWPRPDPLPAPMLAFPHCGHPMALL